MSRHRSGYPGMVYPAPHDTLAAPLPLVAVDLTNEGPTVGQIVQPPVPANRAEKERAKLGAQLAHVLEPTPPMPVRTSWATTQAPLQLTLAETRMSRIRTPN